ncbi:MAG: hypothetical protein HC903_31780 [Methylacidiphilales bacterium]|nr:hypothetical protein [Candidatus Methylacidiphilales bacterium]NJR19500.1 hypothetical protein [Calothrix sp. CSU_2_0]
MTKRDKQSLMPRAYRISKPTPVKSHFQINPNKIALPNSRNQISDRIFKQTLTKSHLQTNSS